MKLKNYIFVFIFFIFILSNVFAATKEDVISAINKTYSVSETKNYRLPQKYIDKGVEYLNSHPLTSAQYSRILAAINKAVEFAREVGHTNYKQYTKEQLNRALNIVLEACKAADVDLNEEIKKEQESKVEKKETKKDKPVIKQEKPAIVTPIPEIRSGEDTLENISGENLTQNIEFSGEVNKAKETTEKVIEETVLEKVSEINYENIVIRNIILVIFVIFVIILLNIFIIRLIIKKKRNKIIRNLLIVLFSLFTIVEIIALGLIIYYFEEIKIVYELYYLFNS